MPEDLIQILLKERARIFNEADPLRRQIAELQKRLAASINDIGPIETLLRSRGWKPDEHLQDLAEPLGMKSPLIPDFFSLAVEWSKTGTDGTTRDFSDWVAQMLKLDEEPNRDAIRNALKKAEKERYITVTQVGQGRRPTHYALHPELS